MYANNQIDNATLNNAIEQKNSAEQKYNTIKQKLDAIEVKYKESEEAQTSNNKEINEQLVKSNSKKERYKQAIVNKDAQITTLEDTIKELEEKITTIKATYDEELNALNHSNKQNENKQNIAKSIKQLYVRDNMFIPRQSKDAEKIANEIKFMYKLNIELNYRTKK